MNSLLPNKDADCATNDVNKDCNRWTKKCYHKKTSPAIAWLYSLFKRKPVKVIEPDIECTVDTTVKRTKSTKIVTNVRTNVQKPNVRYKIEFIYFLFLFYIHYEDSLR